MLWMLAALVGIVGTFLPGSQHQATALVLAVGVAVFLYGLASITGWIPWERASMDSLAIGMVLTIPVAGFALYVTGGSLSYILAAARLPAALRRLLLPRALGLALGDRADPGGRGRRCSTTPT